MRALEALEALLTWEALALLEQPPARLGQFLPLVWDRDAELLEQTLDCFYAHCHRH
jgi:hypothetical protein